MSDDWCPDHDGSHCHALRDLAERVSRLESASDIAGDPMSHNDPIKDIQPKRSPEYLSGYQAGFVDGYFTDSEQIAPIVAILTDLIAELRGDTGICDDVGVKEYIDRAEARLKGLNDE